MVTSGSEVASPDLAAESWLWSLKHSFEDVLQLL